MFLVGFAIIVLSICGSIFMLGGDVWDFLYMPSLVIVIGTLVSVLIATRSFKMFLDGLRSVIISTCEISEETRLHAISLFRLLSKMTMMAASIVTLIALVNVLIEWGAIYHGDACGVCITGLNIWGALLALFYTMVINIAVLEPAVFILKKRSSARGTNLAPQVTNNKRGIIILLLGFTMLLICIWFAITELSGYEERFLNLQYLLTITLPLVGVLMATRSLKMFVNGLNAMAFPKDEITSEMHARVALLFKLLSKTAAIVSIMSLFIRLIITLSNLNFTDADGGIAYFCSNMADAIIAPIYALILIITVFEPVAFTLKNQYP